MDRIENQGVELLELGVASVETKGFGSDLPDTIGQPKQVPMGMSDD